MLNIEKKTSGKKQNPEVSTNDMLVWIERYTKEFRNEDIKISKLAKFSKISRHYWYDRKGIKEKIDEINSIKYGDYEIRINSIKKQLLEIPDVDSLVENNYKNKARLKAIISHYFGVMQEFYDSACKVFEFEKEYKKLKKENENIKNELSKIQKKMNEYKEQALYYKNQLRTESVRSTEIGYRKENNIPENIIDITKSKKVALSTNSDELENMLNCLDSM